MQLKCWDWPASMLELLVRAMCSQPVSSPRFPIGHRFAGPPWARRHPSPWRAQCALSLGVKTVLVFKRPCRLNPTPMFRRSTHSVEVGAMSGCAIPGKSRRNKAGTKPDARFQPHPRRQLASLLGLHAEAGQNPEKTKENCQVSQGDAPRGTQPLKSAATG